MHPQDLIKVSADAHVDEPHDLWFERLPAHLRDRAPRRIQANADGGWTLVVDGNSIGWNDLSARDAAENERARSAAVSPARRVQMMREDGIHAEVVYPTIGLYSWGISDAEVGAAACRLYNDWIIDRLGGHDRIKVAAMIPTWDLQMAVAEVRRLCNTPTVAGFLLPMVGTPEWNLPVWEPLWSVIAGTGKPALMHQGTGHDMIFYRGWGSPTANLLATQSMAPRAAALLSCSGVLERNRDLHVVLVEVNAGWLAWTCATLDEYYQAHQGWSKPVLAELPSHYIRSQVHATFQDDPVAIHNLPLTGPSCLMWGNDYPHPESTFPESDQVLTRLLAGVADDEAAAVVGGNAQRLFNFSADKIASLVS